jgi:chemotaxis protein methyltransferase CheR
MNGSDYDHFCRTVHERSGLVLTPDKSYLVLSRLESVARSEGVGGVPQLLAALRSRPQEVLIQRCVDAMATHESSFFRDIGPFELLASSVLPPLIHARDSSRRLRIWCAACSSGQEPYSLAIALQEMGGRLSGWKFEIVATDMSNAILQKARGGLYSDFEVKRGLSPERLSRWFTRDGTGWRISPRLQQTVQFRPHNLLNGAVGLGVFDLIFCRNVLIYFDLDGKRRVLGDLSRALAADGVLFLGSSETVRGVSTAFEDIPNARGLYRRANVQAAHSTSTAA